MEFDLKKLEEKYSKNRPTFSFIELIKCIALIVLGCIVFSFMPEEMGILGWILFVIGSFLNIVGIFRLAATVPGVKNESDRKVASAISVIAAVFIQCIGLLYLYNSGGTGKGIALATLALCSCLGLIIYAVDFENTKHKKKLIVACRIITVFLVAIAVLINVRDGFSGASVYVGTMLVIEAVITGKIGLERA